MQERCYGDKIKIWLSHTLNISPFNEHVKPVTAECTFIVLDKQRWTDPSMSEEECMVGDVNLFLTDPADPSLAELEIMIAGDRPDDPLILPDLCIGPVDSPIHYNPGDCSADSVIHHYSDIVPDDSLIH